MKIEAGCLCMIVNTTGHGRTCTAVRYIGLGIYVDGKEQRLAKDMWMVTAERVKNKKLPDNIDGYGIPEKNLQRIDGKDFSHEKEKELVK